MFAWRLRVLRRAVVVLAWLVLALSVPAAGGAESARLSAPQVCSLVVSAVAAPLAPRAACVAPRRAARSSSVARGVRLERSARSTLVDSAPTPARDGRRLYLENSALLC
jgi:hypothetical protein